MLEAGKRVRALGYHGIVLGSAEGAEEFYEKLGFKGLGKFLTNKICIVKCNFLLYCGISIRSHFLGENSYEHNKK